VTGNILDLPISARPYPDELVRAAWIRRGDVFAVHAPGNQPEVHGLWLEALALGYRVAIRPSRREPLTPYRLISALRASGFGDDQIVLLPTDYDAAGEILHQADLGMVFGGQDVIDKYATDPAVLPNGPGRPKILITADSGWREHLDMIDSASDKGGTACVNASAVFVEGDPARSPRRSPSGSRRSPACHRKSLVLTAVTKDERLLDDLLADPTIKNLYIGDHPTYWMEPGIPHDSYLAECLMRTQAVIRD
jgi:hypothetical protein